MSNFLFLPILVTTTLLHNIIDITRYKPLKIGMGDVGSSQWWLRLHADFQTLYLVIYKILGLNFYVLLKGCQELLLCKIPGWSMHLFLSKSTRFGSTEFASLTIDDVGCSRCPQCVNWLYNICPHLVKTANVYFFLFLNFDISLSAWYGIKFHCSTSYHIMYIH